MINHERLTIFIDNFTVAKPALEFWCLRLLCRLFAGGPPGKHIIDDVLPLDGRNRLAILFRDLDQAIIKDDDIACRLTIYLCETGIFIQETNAGHASISKPVRSALWKALAIACQLAIENIAGTVHQPVAETPVIEFRMHLAREGHKLIQQFCRLLAEQLIIVQQLIRLDIDLNFIQRTLGLFAERSNGLSYAYMHGATFAEGVVCISQGWGSSLNIFRCICR